MYSMCICVHAFVVCHMMYALGSVAVIDVVVYSDVAKAWKHGAAPLFHFQKDNFN